MSHGNQHEVMLNRQERLYKVSIIVPVYNVQDFLRQCLDSVVNQTLKDIEIILVDDGSTDESGRICDEYAEIDDRVKVIHKSNQGLSSARNDGINASTTDYIMFVDADDWVDSRFCAIPYHIAVERNADLVLFSYNCVNRNGKTVRKNCAIQEGMLSIADGLRYNVFYASYAWLGLYSKRLFQNVRFPVGRMHEDVYTSHKLIYSAKKIYHIDSYLYYYRYHRQGSITSSFNICNNPDVRFVLCEKVKDLCKWGYEEYTQKDAISLVMWYGRSDESQKPLVDILNNSKANCSCLTWKRRVMFALFKIWPTLFDAICIVTGRRQ